MRTPSGFSVEVKPLNRGAWWCFFILASVLASLGFKTFKIFTLTPNIRTAALWLMVMLLLGLTLLVLAYDSYVQESIKQNVHRPVKLFDWMINRRIFLKTNASKKEMSK